MLKHTRIQRYKSLVDVSVDLEPLTVFIGPNGSGKSSYCEALRLFSSGNGKKLVSSFVMHNVQTMQAVADDVSSILRCEASSVFSGGDTSSPIEFQYKGKVTHSAIYDFVPVNISYASSDVMSSSGEGIANSLAKILFDNRDRFVELEKRFTSLVPNISRIKLDQDDRRNNVLFLIDQYSDFAIPTASVSDGTLRILAFLTALYDVSQPGLICFEEPENGIHPWLLNKLMQLLQTVSTEGISGKPAQIIITTHSPVLLNYVKPEQIRAVELDDKGQTKISALPLESKRFQAAMDAYDGELGELWFTNIFGGNPA